MTVRPRRSALYLPASNPRAIAKARTLACDVVILDLEDAVAPEAKADARLAAVAAIREGGFGARELVVRANGLHTEWGIEDLRALAATQPDAVLIAKVRGHGDLFAVSELLGAQPLWAMIETAAAILRLDAIAAAPNLGVLVLGPNDLALELGASPGPGRAPLLPALALTVAAARAHGLGVLAGVYNAFADADGFAREAAEDAAFGFDGKTLIHPVQIAPANAAFAPSEAAIADARRIVEAFADPEARGKAVLRFDGRMVERLHLAAAERTLARA